MRYPGRGWPMNAPAGVRLGGAADAYARALHAKDIARAQADLRRRQALAPADARKVAIGFLQDRLRLAAQLQQQFAPARGVAQHAARKRARVHALAGLGALGAVSDPDKQLLSIVCGSLLTPLTPTVNKWGAQNYANHAPNAPTTFCQLVAWGDTSPIQFSDAEVHAVLRNRYGAAGFALFDTGTIQNLLDVRFTKFNDGHWEDRNEPGQSMGVVVDDAPDQPHTIVGKVVQATENAVADAAAAASAIVGFIGDAAQELWKILQALGDYAVAFVDLIGWFLTQIVPEITSPAALAGDINPLQPGTKAYNLVTDPSKVRVVNLITIILFGPIAIGFAAFAPTQVMQAFAEGPGGANGLTKFLLDLIAAVNAPSAAQKTKLFIQAFEDLVAILTGGIEISIPALLQIGILIISNIPLPPVGSIIEVILSDPLAQRSLEAKGISKRVAAGIIPITMKCFRANSADEYLQCAQSAIELLFPGFIGKMQREFFVSVNDLRVVVSALWASNGDPTLLLDNTKFPGVHDALVGVGVIAIAHVAKTIEVDVTTFIAGLKGAISDDLLNVLVIGEEFVFHVVNASDAIVAGNQLGNRLGLNGLGVVTMPGLVSAGLSVGAAAAKSTSAGAAVATGAQNLIASAQQQEQQAEAAATSYATKPLPVIARRAVWHLQKARWDVKRAVMSMRLDEYTNDVWSAVDGGDGLTRISDASLFKALRVDPNDATKGLIPAGQALIDFLIKTFGDPIAHFFSDLLGGKDNVPNAIAAARASPVRSGQEAAQNAAKLPPGKFNNIIAATGGAKAPVVKTTSKASVVSGALVGGGTGFAVGGPAGAVVGLLVGSALGSRAK